MQFILVFCIVGIGITTALLLDFASTISTTLKLAILSIMVLVLGLNFLRFLLWGLLHKQFDLSKTYPLTTIYFPLIYVISLAKGDAHLELTKLVGVALIIVGVIILQKNVKESLATLFS